MDGPAKDFLGFSCEHRAPTIQTAHTSALRCLLEIWLKVAENVRAHRENPALPLSFPSEILLSQKLYCHFC